MGAQGYGIPIDGGMLLAASNIPTQSRESYGIWGEQRKSHQNHSSFFMVSQTRRMGALKQEEDGRGCKVVKKPKQQALQLTATTDELDNYAGTVGVLGFDSRRPHL